ncbi:hypothetical protein WJ978_19645 [Achromobacter xylosoxidans]
MQTTKGIGSPLFASVNGTTVCPVAVCLPFPHVSGMQEANAAFIMAARAALPALLDEVERLRALSATQAEQGERDE